MNEGISPSDVQTSESENKQVKQYSLSVEDFSTAPQAPEGEKQKLTYKFGDKVTRENFLPMFLQSFITSKGAISSQWAYMEWLSAKTGFDYKTTIYNFREAGGMDSLTGDENAYAEQVVNNVKYNHLLLKNVQSFIHKGVDGFIENGIEDQDQIDRYQQTFTDLEAMSPRELFKAMEKEARYQKVMRRVGDLM